MAESKKLLGDYSEEPKRTPQLVINSQEPFNAETPPPLLVKDFMTPVELFYVRNHGPSPDLDATSYKIEIAGAVVPAIELSLSEVRAIGKTVTIDATLTCAGVSATPLRIFSSINLFFCCRIVATS